MKRALSLLLAAVLALNLTACGSGDPASSTTSSAVSSSSQDGDGIDVDKGLLNVEVTLPASLFEDQTPEEIQAGAKENNFKECTIHEDGSVTYKMSRKQHEEMLVSLREGMDQSIREMTTGEEAIASFQKIEYNEDLSKFDVYVDQSKSTPFDGLAVFAFYMSGLYYQSFAGVEADKIDVVVNFIDNATGELTETSSLHEFLEAQEQAG